MNDVVREIKDRLTIEDVVRPYVQLKKIGLSLKGLCPFHAEKTPSFVVSPEKQIAYCFGCNKGGDIFKFTQEIEGVDFPAALKSLADRAGLKIEKSGFPQVSSGEKELVLQMYENVCSYYEDQLWHSAPGEKVLAYLQNRGLKSDFIKLFRLGFAPDSFSETIGFLLKKGFQRKDIVSAGLALSHEITVEKTYDRFRGRLIFPIMDTLGRVIAFGGRALKKDQEPKYLNSPETVLYHKSKMLYGFSFAKQSIKQKQEAVIVEGYMDLIALHQAGLKNVVATSGTALTIQHLRILQPFISTLYFAFDNDQAGYAATLRAFEVAQGLNFTIKILHFPQGKDAAEYLQSLTQTEPDSIARYLAVLFEKSLFYGDFFYKRLFQTHQIKEWSSKKKILQEFLPFFSLLQSSVEKDTYVRKLAMDLDLKEVQIYDEIKNFKLPLSHPARQKDDFEKAKLKYSCEDLFLGFMFEYPFAANFFLTNFDFNMETLSPEGKILYNVFIGQYNQSCPESSIQKAMALLPADLREKVVFISLYLREHYGEMDSENLEKEFRILANNLKRRFLNMRARDLQMKIKQAEEQSDSQALRKLLEEFHGLYKVDG